MGQSRDGVYKQCPCPDEWQCTKKHGTWTYRVRLGTDPVTGRPVRRKKGGFRTRREAVEARNRLLAERADGGLVDDRGLTVGQWLDRWYEEQVRRPDPPEFKTLQGYETNIRIWKSVLANVRLRDLDRDTVNDALVRLGKPRTESERPAGRHGQWKECRSVTTLERYRATLRRALNVAAERNLIRSNPAAGRLEALVQPKAAKVAKASAPRQVWAAHETEHFFTTIADHPWCLLYGCYALTGARRAEWIGAQWGRMSPPGDSIFIGPTVVTGAGRQPCFVCGHGHQGRRMKPLPKSANSFRWLPLPDQLRDALREHRRAIAAGDRPSGHVDHDLVFPDVDGGPLHPDHVTDEFHRLVAKAGLPRLTGPHALRHNAVSMMLHLGTPVEEVAKITGHDVATLRRHYAHIIERYARRSLQTHADTVLGRGWAQNGSK